MKKNTSVDWYDVNATTFYNRVKNDEYPLLYSNFLKKLPKAGRILDIGCAAGRDVKRFSELGYNTTGIDLSSASIKLALQNDKESTYFIASAEKLPFVENTFDGIWNMATLLHLDGMRNIIRSIKEEYRVLSSKGIISIITGYKFDKTRIFYTDSIPSRRFFRVTKEEMQDICEKAGFKTIISEILCEDVMYKGGRNNMFWVYYLGRK